MCRGVRRLRVSRRAQDGEHDAGARGWEAIEKNPNDPLAVAMMAWLLQGLGFESEGEGILMDFHDRNPGADMESIRGFQAPAA